MSSCQVRPVPNIDNPLWEYFLNNKERTIWKWTHYFDIYHNHFERFRNKPVNILEIGVFKGGSLQMWRNYFGPQARIFGIDNDPAVKFEDPQVKIFIGSQNDPIFLKQVINDIAEPIDIVIDDASHVGVDQVISFKNLYPAMRDNGVYLVEDLNVNYSSLWKGGYKKSNNFMEYTKKMIDVLYSELSSELTNALKSSGDVDLVNDIVSVPTTGIHIYKSVTVFERYPFAPLTDMKKP